MGDYVAVTRRIRVLEAGETTVVAEVEDSGPTWAGTSVHILNYAEASRLVGVDNNTMMEYGTLADGSPWIRYRGRVHVRVP